MKKAYTLIELLVVLAIISVLIGAAFAILRPLDYIKRSRDSRRQSDLKVVQSALEQYYSNNNVYPTPSGTYGLPFGSAWTVGSITYLRSTPNDPNSSSGANYCYVYPYPSGTANYDLCANLELPGSGAPSVSVCGTTYNYCVTNPF